MKTTIRLVLMLIVGISAIWAGSAFAVEFKNVGAAPAIMYDAPSVRGEKLYIAPPNMPVEVVINYGAWSKVRDFAGDLSWVENKQLVERKHILVKNLYAKIRANPEDSASVVFSADKGVLLEVLDANPTGWIKVKHSDGSVGYIKQGDAWGV